MSSHHPQTEWRVSILVPEKNDGGDVDDGEGPVYQQHYLLRHLAASSAYQLEVRARNRHGWSHPSTLHTFFTLPGDSTVQYSTVHYRHY